MVNPADDKMTPSRKLKLVVKALFETAEDGGMNPKDCGSGYDLFSECFDNLCKFKGGEEGLADLIDMIQEILASEKSDPAWDENS